MQRSSKKAKGAKTKSNKRKSLSIKLAILTEKISDAFCPWNKCSRDLQNEDMKLFHVSWTPEELVICKLIHCWKGNISHYWKRFSEQGDGQGWHTAFVIHRLRALFECYVSLYVFRWVFSTYIFFYNFCPSFNFTCESLKTWKGTGENRLFIFQAFSQLTLSRIHQTAFHDENFGERMLQHTGLMFRPVYAVMTSLIEAELVVVYWVLQNPHIYFLELQHWAIYEICSPNTAFLLMTKLPFYNYYSRFSSR